MININDKEVIVLGAGGVAKGVIFALKKSGVKEIKLFNRTIEKAQKLASEIVKPYSFDKIEESIKMDSIIINCTSVGMKNNNSPLNVNFLSSLQIIIDTIYTPLQTTLLINAKNAGAQTMNGLDMFIHQGLASLDIWFGEPISDRVNVTDIKNNLEKILC
jgi:shikimate dehydrogenase